MEKIIECVMNVSEGKDKQVIEAIANCFKSHPHVLLMDINTDADYHRSVFSILGELSACYDAVLKATKVAIKRIDMRKHQGVHPRIGAVDVIPFIPIKNTSMQECIDVANKLASTLAKDINIPVFLYDQAATHQDNVHLSAIRKVEFEGLNQAFANHQLNPDYGPLKAHPHAGAIAIGARNLLIAYNITINSSDVSIAQAIAKRIRFSSGGLASIKAKGVYLASNNTTQVTINITDYHQTSIKKVFTIVSRLAKESQTQVLNSEIIGLIPKAALEGASASELLLNHPLDNRILDTYIHDYIRERRQMNESKEN